jgi:hypothetical protein
MLITKAISTIFMVCLVVGNANGGEVLADTGKRISPRVIELESGDHMAAKRQPIKAIFERGHSKLHSGCFVR